VYLILIDDEKAVHRVANVPHIASLYKWEVAVDNPKLIKTVASKEPIKTTGKRCKIIYRAERDGYIQADSFVGKFKNWILWIKATDKIYWCYDINK